MSLQPLKWDSKFFSLKIGKISLAENPEDFSGQHIKNYDLIYIEQVNSGKIKKKYSGIFNIGFTDKKTSYLKKLKGIAGKPDKNINEYLLKTANSRLKDLAVQSGVYSRFRLDKNFGEDFYKKLYIRWIQNSVTKKSANMVLIYGDIKNPSGFITLLFNEKEAQIGLIAVDAAQQNKGIGKALISAAEYFAIKNKCSKLKVVTQTENNKACRFYEKRGFTKEAVIYTHHHWNK